MQNSRRLLQHACRITFFTRSTCSLCTTARNVLEAVLKTDAFHLEEKDVDLPMNQKWKDVYDFDVPVIHVEPSNATPNSNPSAEYKLMHRFTQHQVSALMSKVARDYSYVHTMQAANTLQRSLKSGKPAFGAWQMLPGTNLSRTLCRSGANWILVDCEHGQISDDNMHESVTAIAACGVSPIVRIPAAESWMIKRALDSGAHGIMCPLLETAQDATNLVNHSKFPPLGKRGYGSPFSMGSFATGDNPTPTQVDYLHHANDSLLTIIQIETKEALENVDAIAAVPGVDVLFVGPFDLGNNIGHPILTGEQDPELKSAIDKIRVAAKKAGKWSGIYCTSGFQARMYAGQGFDMANVTNDVMALSVHFGTQYTAARNNQVQGEITGPYGR